MIERASASASPLLILRCADQFTKWLVTGPPTCSRSARSCCCLLPSTWTENCGISLGLLNATSRGGALDAGRADRGDRDRRRRVDRPREERGRPDRARHGAGGALGNILDRIRFGYVVDFADLHFGDFRPFLVFNVGDAAISIGVVILLLRAFLIRMSGPRRISSMRKLIPALLLLPVAAERLFNHGRPPRGSGRIRGGAQCAADHPARLHADAARRRHRRLSPTKHKRRRSRPCSADPRRAAAPRPACSRAPGATARRSARARAPAIPTRGSSTRAPPRRRSWPRRKATAASLRAAPQ